MFGLKFLLRRRSLNRDLDEELRAHLAIDKEERIESGESPQAAEQSARYALGNELLIKEVTRQMWGWAILERIWRDLVYTLRQLKRFLADVGELEERAMCV